jgi:hypothetical protein
MAALISVYKLDVRDYEKPQVMKQAFNELPLLEVGEEYQLSAWIGSLRGSAVTYETVTAIEGYRPTVYGTGRNGANNFNKALQTSLLNASYEFLSNDKSILAVSLRMRKKKHMWWRIAIWTIPNSEKPDMMLYRPPNKRNYSPFTYTDPSTEKERALSTINMTK